MRAGWGEPGGTDMQPVKTCSSGEHKLISVQSTCRSRSSLARPSVSSSLQITNRCGTSSLHHSVNLILFTLVLLAFSQLHQCDKGMSLVAGWCRFWEVEDTACQVHNANAVTRYSADKLCRRWDHEPPTSIPCHSSPTGIQRWEMFTYDILYSHMIVLVCCHRHLASLSVVYEVIGLQNVLPTPYRLIRHI